MKTKLSLLALCLFAITAFAQKDGDDISIGKYRIIHSEILDEDRTILVHLPPNYNDSDKEYPVLYMLYGNHTTTYFAETVSVLDNYGGNGQIPEMILVSIMNTNRYRDLLPLDRSGNKTGIDNFLKFFKEELIPFIDKNYRTKDFRALLGPQAGANFSMYTMFKEPSLFDAFFINNPFRWTGGREELMEMAKTHFQNNETFKKFMFITHDESDELEIKGNEYIKKFEKIVTDNKLMDFTLELNFLPQSKDFISPIGIKEGLLSFFKDYVFPEGKPIENLKTITDYYDKLSIEYGFNIDVSGVFLVVEADKLIAKGKKKEYMEILHYIIETNANPENAYWRIGDIEYKAGNLEGAKNYLEKMMGIVGSDNGMIKARYNEIVKKINAQKD